MTIQVALYHHTRYRFDRPVALSPHEIRLRPAAHCRTPIHSYSLTVEPASISSTGSRTPTATTWRAGLPRDKPRADGDGRSARGHDGHQSVRLLRREIRARSIHSATPSVWPKELAPFLERGAGRAAAAGLARAFQPRRSSTGDGRRRSAGGANGAAAARHRYIVRMEPGVSDLRGDAERKRGSCRDTAWLLVQILRHLGLAARFVSGYLIQLTADVKALDGPAGAGSGLHRSARLGGGVSFPAPAGSASIPTSGLFAGEGHIPLACTAGSGERGAGDRTSADPMRGAVRVRDERDAHPRGSARHQALHRSAVERHRSARAAGRRGAEGAETCASRWAASRPSSPSTTWTGPQWNTERWASEKRRARPACCCGACASLRAGRPAALRPRQVVSRRTAAALGAELPVARRWHTAVARRRAHRGRGQGLLAMGGGTRRPSAACWRDASACTATISSPPMRMCGCAQSRAGDAGECRPARAQLEGRR